MKYSLVLVLAIAISLAVPTSIYAQQQQQQQLAPGQEPTKPLQPRDFRLNPNFWGDVVSDRAIEEGAEFGQHTSDPVQSIPGREVPRDGVGNVQVNPSELEKHPSFHAFELCQTFPNAAGCPAELPDTTIPP